MSLVGFRAKNHTQQVRKRGASDTVDERITPESVFGPLNAEHGFTLDAAANERNKKCANFYSLSNSGLENSWDGHVVWCNPPYSDIAAWVRKALAEVTLGACKKVVMLLPANRTEQRWWQEYIEPVRDCGKGVSTMFLQRRLNFGTPDNPTGKYNSSAPFGCVVVVIERK